MLYEKVLDNWNAKLQKLAEPVTRAQNLTWETLEKISQIQLGRLSELTDIGLESLREASSIQSPEAFQAYITKQIEKAGEVTQTLTEDASHIQSMSNGYLDEIQNAVGQYHLLKP
jgi:phasin family protein